MTHKVTISDDCVYEGYGEVYCGENESSPPLPYDGINNNNNNNNSDIIYCSLDNKEALRQLRTALKIDVPPQLISLNLFEKKSNEYILSNSVWPRRLVYPLNVPSLKPLPSLSYGTQYEIERMKLQCRMLRESFMLNEIPEEEKKTKELLYTLEKLFSEEVVEELLNRTKGILQELENWPQVVNAVRSQINDWNEVTTLLELQKFSKEILQTEEYCKQLSNLTGRFYLIAPLVEEAALRSAAFEEIEQWSSENILSSLRTLNETINNWELKMIEDQQNMLDSTQMLMNRIDALNKKKEEKNTQ